MESNKKTDNRKKKMDKARKEGKRGQSPAICSSYWVADG